MKNRSVTTLSALLVGSTISICNAQNVLIIVADDLGKEVLSIYDTPTKERAKTPNIDRLSQQGITFDNFWGYPLSAPVRAAMLTGRYGHHTGIVALDITLPTSEVTLFEALPNNYTNALFGKWHLSRDLNFAPNYGIKHFEGFAMGGGVRDYNNWRFTQNGSTVQSTKYVTSQITDSAKDWIKRQREPWVCWVAYNAPHTPIHLPPSNMHTRKLKGSVEDIEKNPLPYYLAMVESLDYEIGRLLKDVDESTTVIFVGDNGTANEVLQSPYPFRHGKGSLYEPGVSVPLVVSGKGVTKVGTRSNVAVNAVDIFPTVLELSGKSTPSYEDSFSFSQILSGGEGMRKYTFSEIYNKRMGYTNAISDGEYKIITTPSSTMLFNLVADPLEQNDLMRGNLSKKDKEALLRLQEELRKMNIPKVDLPQSTPQREGAGNRPRQQANFNNQNRVRR